MKYGEEWARQEGKAGNLLQQKNKMKEDIQAKVLCGLSRAGFFEKAAFYGGTALRLFHNLDRFSEDLDFSLFEKNPNFCLSSYFPQVEKELKSFGMKAHIEEKEKRKDSIIRSAFVKSNTREYFLRSFAGQTASIPHNELIKIKLEVDISPPAGANFERKYCLRPAPYRICLYDPPSLFAGKIHAVLARAWVHRTKGRDLYDYVFYLSRNIPVNLFHLEQRLIDSSVLKETEECDQNTIKNLLVRRFAEIDFSQAKEDVRPFLKNGEEVLELWSADFFISITDQLTFA